MSYKKHHRPERHRPHSSSRRQTSTRGETASSDDTDSSTLNTRKTWLEVLRLAQDIAAFSETSNLQLKKLNAELSELKKGPRRATIQTSLSVFVSFLIGVATVIVTLSINHNAAQEADLETYRRLLSDVSNPSAAARSAAIIGLAPNVQHLNDRTEQTVTLLTHRLASESDPGTLRLLITTLSDLREPTVREMVLRNVVDVNREARANLTDAYGKNVAHFAAQQYLSANDVPERERLYSLSKHWREIAKKTSKDYETLVTHDESAIAADLVAHNLPPNKSSPSDTDVIHALLTDPDFEDATNSVLNSMDFDSEPKPGEQRANVFQAFRAVAASGKVLQKALTAAPATDSANVSTPILGVIGPLVNLPQAPASSASAKRDLPKIDLSGIAIINFDIKDDNLPQLQLSHAFVAGFANGTNLRQSDFSCADISQLDVTKSRTGRKTDLSGTTLLYASLPARLIDDDAADDLPNMVSADWWDARDLAFVNTLPAQNRIARFRDRMTKLGHVPTGTTPPRKPNGTGEACNAPPSGAAVAFTARQHS